MPSRAEVTAELTRLEQELATSEAGSLALAKRDFGEFLKYVSIFEKPPGRGKIPWEPWEHLGEVIEALPTSPLAVWMKSRRDGATWLISAWVVFLGQRPGGYFPLVSKGEVEAIEFLEKVRFIYRNLPEALRWGDPVTDSRTEMKWGNTGTHFHAMPSTGNASRGAAITLAVIDEADYHEYLKTFYYAVKPSVDDSKGQLIVVSTVNPDNPDSLFTELYNGAPVNGFRRFFHGWRARKDRDQAWYDARRSEYPDKARFEKEFPETAEQAMAPPETLAAFDRPALDAMRQDCREPLETLHSATHIWQKWYTGKKYVMFTDTSHGVGADDAVTVVMDVGTGYVVADVHSNLIPPETLALYSVELSAQYGHPVWAIEDNDWGEVTIKKAQALRYPRLYYRAEGQPGWHTNERTRMPLWGDLLEAVGKRLITVPSQAGLGQFYSVIRNPKKEGRIEGQAGRKDDYPFAVAGAWQLRYRAVATHGQSPVAVSAPLEFQRNPAGRAPGLRW
jgi:hypothetical protein